MVEELKESRASKVFRLGDMRLYECPLSYISSESAEIIRLVFLVEGSSSLLVSGGWADQPAWFVEAYEIYRTEFFKEVKDRDNESKI